MKNTTKHASYSPVEFCRPLLSAVLLRKLTINTSLLFRRKDFSRPVMYYSNSNAIFQPELLIICGDVNVNPGPLTKRNQARSTAPTCHAVARNQRRFVCWMCHNMTHVTCSSSTADSRVFSASSPVSLTCNRCAFASLPFLKESSSDDNLTPSLNFIRLLRVVINTPSVTSESTGRY